MSKCKYCKVPIIWVQKPGGAWYPPFNCNEALQSMQYELVWDTATADWTATPVDKGLAIKLTTHDCESRQEFFRRQLAEEEEMKELPPPSVGTLNIPERKIHERVIVRNPKPLQYIKVAKRLSVQCPVCWAKPFVWCHYVNTDKETVNLHTRRGASYGQF